MCNHCMLFDVPPIVFWTTFQWNVSGIAGDYIIRMPGERHEQFPTPEENQAYISVDKVIPNLMSAFSR